MNLNVSVALSKLSVTLKSSWGCSEYSSGLSQFIMIWDFKKGGFELQPPFQLFQHGFFNHKGRHRISGVHFDSKLTGIKLLGYYLMACVYLGEVYNQFLSKSSVYFHHIVWLEKHLCAPMYGLHYSIITFIKKYKYRLVKKIGMNPWW